jgi:hypothetical protein
MAMTVDQMITLFSKQADMHWNSAQSSLEAGNYDLLSFNLTSCLDSHLMAGLLKWRVGEANPAGCLFEVCKVASRGLELLQSMAPGRPHWRSFNVLPAAYCGLLIGETTSLPIEAALNNSSQGPAFNLTQQLDACIINAIGTKKPPLMWDEISVRFSQERRMSLLHATYGAYLQIALAEQSEQITLVETVNKAAALFQARARDTYYAGGRGTDGGGPDNKNVVDYRLAALVRQSSFCRDQSFDEVASVHLWKW